MRQVNVVVMAWVLAALPAPVRADPADRVKQVIADQVTAWNRGDLDAFCAGYADDALFLSPSGDTRGRQAVLERYRKRYPSRDAMGTLKIETIEVRLLPSATQPLAVTVAGRWSLAYPKKPTASGLTLLVFRPRGDGWEIVQDASM